jgi:transposase
MPSSPLLPSVSELGLEHIVSSPDLITMVARTCRTRAACPACSQVSDRVHSRYVWTIADLPSQGTRVRFRLHSRRFFCDQSSCARQTFSEHLPDTVKVSELGARKQFTLKMSTNRECRPLVSA